MRSRSAAPPAPADDLGGAPGAQGATRGEGDGEGGEASAPQPAKPRMVHYNGFLRLKVTSPEETLAAASKTAEAAGGYVESLSPTAVTLRVPVAALPRRLRRAHRLGDVLARSMTAQDVTEEFHAAELRLKTLRASRERLRAALGERAHGAGEDGAPAADRPAHRGDRSARAAGDDPRVARRVLADQRRDGAAAGVPGGVVEEPVAAFRWIHELSPFRRDVAQAG